MIPTWFDFVKGRLASGETMQQATSAYFERYYHELYLSARDIAERMITESKGLIVPEEISLPNDLPVGLQLVMAIVETKALSD